MRFITQHYLQVVFRHSWCRLHSQKVLIEFPFHIKCVHERCRTWCSERRERERERPGHEPFERDANNDISTRGLTERTWHTYDSHGQFLVWAFRRPTLWGAAGCWGYDVSSPSDSCAAAPLLLRRNAKQFREGFVET